MLVARRACMRLTRLYPYLHHTGQLARAMLLVALGVLATLFPISLQAAADRLTPREREWLQQHGPLRYAVQNFSPPVEFRGATNVVAGITPDLLRVIATNLDIEVEWLLSSKPPRDLVLSGEADFAGVWAETRNRSETLLFTRPYLWVSNAYVVRSDSGISRARDLANRKVGIVENSAVHEWSKAQKQLFDFVPVSTSREGLLLVSSGRLDALLDLEWLSQRLIALDGLLNLRFLSETPFATPRQFIVGNTNAILLGILEKGLDTVKPQDRARVMRTWTLASPRQNGHQVAQWVWQTVLALALVGALLVLWVLALRDQVKRRTRELEAAKEHFRALYENTPIPYHSLDDQGRVLQVNLAWAEMLGYNKSEVLGREFKDFVEPAQQEAWLKRFELLRTQGSAPSLECTVMAKNGTPVIVVVESRTEKDNTARLHRTHCVMRNVTERRRAEAALHANRALLQAIVDGTEDAVFAKDKAGRYLLFNRAASKMVNKRPEDVVGKTDEVIFPPEDIEAITNNDRSIMARGETDTFDETITLADGKKHEFLVIKGPLRNRAGEIVGIFGMSRDITERVRITDALRRSETRLAAAQRIARLGSWELVLRGFGNETAQDLWWSDEVYRIFGYEPGEVAASRNLFLQAVHPADRDRVMRTVEQALHTGERYELEHRIILKDGSERTVAEYAEITRDPEGRVTKLSGTVQDISEAKRIRAEIEEQQRFISAVAGNTPDCIAVYDLTLARSVYQNRPITRILGYTDPRYDTMVSEQLLDLIHPEDTARLYAHMDRLARAADHEVNTYEYRMRRPDGTYAWFEARSIVFKRDETGNVAQVLSVAQEVTNRKITEARIRHLNRVYAVLSDINQVIVRSSDTDDMLREACRIAVDKGGFQLAWIGRAGPPPAPFEIAAHAGATQETLDLLNRLFNTPDDACYFTAEALRTNGHSVCNDIATDSRAVPWRDDALKRGYRSMAAFGLRLGDDPYGVFCLYSAEAGFFDEAELKLLDELALDIAFALEISRREILRQQVEEAHQRLATAVEQAAEAIVITNASADVLYANPAFERVSGYSLREILGKNPRILKSGRHDQSFYKQMWSTLASGRVWSGRLTNRRKDGTLFEEEATISPIRDEQGRITNYVAVKRDVTREVQMEAQLRQSQKMEAVGQLAGGVAHDFNNILAALLMWIELLRENPSESELKSGFNEMQELVQRASSLTRQLLLFGRRQLMQPRVLDLNSLLGNLLKMLGRLIGEHITLTLHESPQALWIEADPGMIEQVVTNLVVNARDAMPKGGELTLRSTLVTVDGRHLTAHPEARVGTFAVLTVSDNGTGMTDEVLKHAFEPFFTTKDIGKGTGLGLSTVYGIVQQHKGWVEVDTLPGLGSTFRIYLPSHHSPQAEPASGAPPVPLSRGQETILVVEDEPAVRELTVLTLERLGYNVLEAPNGQEALKVWQTQETPIQLLITDVVMPGGLSGVELAQKLRNAAPELKIILMSGYSDEMIDAGGITPEGMLFVQKPFSPAMLAAKVRSLLEPSAT